MAFIACQCLQFRVRGLPFIVGHQKDPNLQLRPSLSTVRLATKNPERSFGANKTAT